MQHVVDGDFAMFKGAHVPSFGAAALALTLAFSTAALGQEGRPPPRDIHRLGGSTALARRPLTSATGLKAMAGNPKVAADLRAVLGQAGLPELADRVLAVMSAANTSVRGGLCSDATPADGIVVECDVPPGQTLRWMAYRPTGTTLGLFQNIRWAGPKPFRPGVVRGRGQGACLTDTRQRAEKELWWTKNAVGT